jgi:hypothetical protein
LVVFDGDFEATGERLVVFKSSEEKNTGARKLNFTMVTSMNFNWTFLMP